MSESSPFDDTYFKRGPYAGVSFEKYSQYWWSNRFFARLARKFGPSQGKVLELGCGLGHLLGWLADRYEVFGADINEPALQEAQKNVPLGKFLVLSAENLRPLPDSSFQIVIAKHLVEHLPHPERAIAEMVRVLAPGGILILATPNMDSPMRHWKKEHWIGYKDPTHISLLTPAKWLGLIRQESLNVRRVFSDGFWDAPYFPGMPTALQKVVFGGPGGLQAIMGWSIIPLRMGESMIVIAQK
jgi:SAM-dependent methyltransferase